MTIKKWRKYTLDSFERETTLGTGLKQVEGEMRRTGL
jgi:hypothetical protein